jgi:eukaryotic-like serine/threonine-protein kinase
MKKCPKCGVEYPDATTLCPADGIALEKTADDLLGTLLSGKYRIDERLSAGGMGTVYRGTHVLMDKTVAIKVLLPTLAADEKIVARFSREARAASRISHPNALSVTDFGEAEGGIVFLVMEYLSGRTLKDVIQNDGPMPLDRAIGIMRQVGDALKAAHDQGVVHRDLKSDNIMLISTTVGDHPMVLDFGIAKIIEPDVDVDSGLTAPNLVIGTPQYMSPEQCSQAGEIDARTDVYSFGVILYEMLVGHVPYTGESPTIVMLKHMQDAVPSVLDEREDLPASIDRIVARAMAKQPEDRYQSINDLLEDLTIAGGVVTPRGTVSTGQPIADRQRPSKPVTDDLDEVTVVRPRPEPVRVPRTPITVPMAAAAPPVPAAGFNPLKILIPSAVALLVVFAAFYAFSGNSTTDANTNTNIRHPTLSPDPNSQPVQVSSPPTGSAEQGIPAGGNTNTATANKNSNANEAAPTPAEVNPSPAATANENSNPKPAPSLPVPQRTASPVQVPVPSPPQPSPTSTIPD